MEDWCDHNVRVVGRPPDIDRFVEAFGIVAGGVDLETGGIVLGWERLPCLCMDLPTGSYHVAECLRGVCCVDIEFGTDGSTMDSWVGVCRSWIDAYPELSIIWRYWFDLGRYSGYIDNAGNHCWHYTNGNWVDEDSNPSPELVHDFGTYDAAKYALSFLSRETIRQVAVSAVSHRRLAIQLNHEHCNCSFEFTWAHVMMTTATEMLEQEVAEKLWRRWEPVDGLDSRKASLCLEEYKFNTLNEAARYVLEPLWRELTIQIAKEAFDVCQDATVECDNDAASVAWAKVILEAASDVFGMGEVGMRRYLQEQVEANTNTTESTCIRPGLRSPSSQRMNSLRRWEYHSSREEQLNVHEDK